MSAVECTSCGATCYPVGNTGLCESCAETKLADYARVVEYLELKLAALQEKYDALVASMQPAPLTEEEIKRKFEYFEDDISPLVCEKHGVHLQLGPHKKRYCPNCRRERLERERKEDGE